MWKGKFIYENEEYIFKSETEGINDINLMHDIFDSKDCLDQLKEDLADGTLELNKDYFICWPIEDDGCGYSHYCLMEGYDKC